MPVVPSVAGRAAAWRLRLLSGVCSLAWAFAFPEAVAAQEASQSAQAAQTQAFAISPQPLSSALTRFADAANLRLLFPSEIVAGLSSPGAQGAMTPDAALARILAGTGLTYRFTEAGAVTIERQPEGRVLAPISAEGATQGMIGALTPVYAGGQVATGGQLGVLGNKDVMNTPFNQINYTAKKVEDQHARTLSDVLIDHPSVNVMAPRSGSNVELFQMRGFLYQSVLYGGLPGMMGSDNTMPELAERVEVLTGPSALLNGNLGMGGTVNLIPKRAPDEGIARFTPGFGSTENLGGHVDVGERFGLNKEFGVRFNGVYRDGETAVEDVSDQRGLGTLGLDYRGERLRLAADLGYQQQNLQGVIPRISLNAAVPYVPNAPDSTKNPGTPWSYKDNEDKFAVVRGEFDVTDSVTAYASFGRHDWQRSFLGNRLTITNVNGTANGTTSLSNFTEQSYAGETGVRTKFATGPVGHELVISAALSGTESGFGDNAGPAFVTNIYNPATISRPNLALPVAKKSSTSDLSSLVIADTLSIMDDRVQLTAGVRDQKVKAAAYNTTTGAMTSSSSESALSPSAGLVVKPLDYLSVYGNYIQGLEPGEVVGAGFANTGAAFPPYKTKQFETGVKVDWGSWTTTAGIFQIERPSVFTDVATNSRVLAGEQRNRGVELNLFGEPVDGVRVLGGAMLLDAVLTKTQGGANDGWEAPSSPELTLRLAGEWDTPFLRGVTLTGRVVHTSEQYIDTAASRRQTPAWTRFDAGIHYTVDNVSSPTGKPIVIRFNIDNLLGEDYWMAPNVMSSPRTFWLSTSFDF